MARLGIEQDRRDFKQANPDLYEYIQAHEIARALDSAGDTVSGAIDGHSAANRMWARADSARRRKSRLLRESLPPGHPLLSQDPHQSTPPEPSA